MNHSVKTRPLPPLSDQFRKEPILTEGPISMSEADLLALENQGRELVEAGRRVRYHLTECPHGDQKTLDALDALLKCAGIHDLVTQAAPEAPRKEMSCTCGEDPF